MNKNEMSRKLMDAYYEEMAIIAAENAKLAMTMDSPDADTDTHTDTIIDPLFDSWYAVSFYYEPVCTKDAVQTTEDQEIISPENLFEDDLYVPNAKDLRRMRVSSRRAKTIAHKRKLGKMAEIMWDGYEKRSYEDMRNSTFCKKRGGAFVQMPKSQSMKADAIIKRAKKQHCFQLEEQETVTTPVVTSDTNNIQSKQKAA